jgi:isoleucyl-tRNA synthetase
MTEKIYKDLTEKDSIFLEAWPEANKKQIDEDLEKNMILVKELIQETLAQRDKTQINVRWPLPNVLITTENPKPLKEFTDIIKTQTNVKQVTFKTGSPSVTLDTKLTPELENEGYLRELTRKIQSLRKKAKLNKDDKIDLTILTKEIFLDNYQDELKEKVNASKLTISSSSEKKFKHSSKEKIKEKEFEINF